MRAEILEQGLVPDQFLNSDSDVPTFGVNLACAWPFPEAWRGPHAELTARLAECGRWLYVYPHAFTHITLVTFMTFSRHVRPSESECNELAELTDRAIAVIEPVLAEAKVFELHPQVPVLSKAAAFLPFQNPDGLVLRLRRSVLGALQRDELLHRHLVAHGLNIPGIIHSTLARFINPPLDVEPFVNCFEAAAEAVKFPPLRIKEICLTEETRPYMRGGRSLEHFSLTDA